MIPLKTETILKGLKVISWIAFIGFSIQAGAMLVSLFICLKNPEAAENFYGGINLLELRNEGTYLFLIYAGNHVLVAFFKAYVWYLVIGLMSKFSLKNPFSMEVIGKLEKISMALFVTWITLILGNMEDNYLHYTMQRRFGSPVGGEFLFMAGLVFVISQIFKRGVEIQSENELTI